MSEYEERRTRERGPAFVAKHQLLNADDVRRALRRMAHEILEHDHDASELSVIGLQQGGAPFARALSEIIAEVAGVEPSLGFLDVTFYRDDLARRPVATSSDTLIDEDLSDRTVVLVDDVLFTGRTIRAALNALTDWGRPRNVRLAVMVDRGHRELPIRADYVGKNLPSARDEVILATLDGVWIGTKEDS